MISINIVTVERIWRNTSFCEYKKCIWPEKHINNLCYKIMHGLEIHIDQIKDFIQISIFKEVIWLVFLGYLWQ